jgi:copper chaperone CopZ
MKMNLLKVLSVIAVVFIAGCGKTDNQTTDTKNDKQEENKESSNKTLEVSATDKAVEIHTSGMTCTGCEKTIKAKVKKVDGVKDVIADFKTNTVKASYDPGKTNPEAIKEAITSSGYKVEDIH